MQTKIFTPVTILVLIHQLVGISIIDWDTVIERKHTCNKMMARKIVSLALITNHILTQWFVYIIRDKSYKNIASDNLSTDSETLIHYSIHSWDKVGCNSSLWSNHMHFWWKQKLVSGPKQDFSIKVAPK